MITKILLIMLVLGLGFFGPRPVHAVSSSTCTPAADFDVVPDPSTLTLQGGETGVVTLTATPIDGFNQPISLVTANVPTDFTVTLSATSLDIGAGPFTFTATVEAPLTIASGAYSFVVNATTVTTLFHETTITVNVPTAELGLTANRDFVAIPQGSLDTVTINLESLYGLPTSTVELGQTVSSVLTASTDPIVSLTPSSVPLSSGGTITSTLTIATSSTTSPTTPGEYSILVSGTTNPGSVTNSTTVTVVVTTATFFLLATPSALEIPAGSTDHSTINATIIQDFSGTVALTAAPPIPVPGLTATLSTPSITVSAGSSTTSDLTITAGAIVFPGSYVVLVTGTSGSTSRQAYVFITVPGPPMPGYSIAGSPDTLILPQTDTPSLSTITLTSLNGFVDTVGLSIDCFPHGLTADITPASVSLISSPTGSATLTVSASSFTVPGNYTVTVFGFGTTTSVSNYTSIAVRVTGADFGLTATPSIVYLTTGGTATSTITATSKLGFSGSIQLEASVFSLTGTGLTASLSKTTLSLSGSESDSATLSLTGTFTGGYEVEVIGASWPLLHTADVFVDVVAPTPDFSLTASPTSLTILQGASTTSTIGISPLYGFTGSVALSATGPTGITATPSPLSISGTATSTLTVSVGSTVAPGSYTVDVMGTSGTFVRHSTIALTVTSTTLTPDFDITTTAAVSFTSGTTGTSTVTVTGTNSFYAYVALTTFAPSGVTVTFSSTSIYPGTSTATFSSSTPGSYAVTITGTSGSLVHSTTVQVTVTAVGTPDFTITSNPPASATVGQSSTSTITVSSVYGFTGTVTLAVSTPSGITCTLDHTALQGSGTATLTCTSNTPNEYTVTVTATGGASSHTMAQTFHVSPAPSPAAPAPTILGLAPFIFYVMIGVVIVAVIGGIAVAIRRRNP